VTSNNFGQKEFKEPEDRIIKVGTPMQPSSIMREDVFSEDLEYE
jgi:hypothetical protein